jgi:hypothetical protein
MVMSLANNFNSFLITRKLIPLTFSHDLIQRVGLHGQIEHTIVSVRVQHLLLMLLLLRRGQCQEREEIRGKWRR